jgi:hypothetical protein
MGTTVAMAEAELLEKPVMGRDWIGPSEWVEQATAER